MLLVIIGGRLYPRLGYGDTHPNMTVKVVCALSRLPGRVIFLHRPLAQQVEDFCRLGELLRTLGREHPMPPCWPRRFDPIMIS